MDYFLSHRDRQDMFEALIIRFRLGEIGPVSFRAEARRLKISEDDINAARDLHIDECASAMDVRAMLPFVSGVAKC